MVGDVPQPSIAKGVGQILASRQSWRGPHAGQQGVYRWRHSREKPGVGQRLTAVFPCSPQDAWPPSPVEAKGDDEIGLSEVIKGVDAVTVDDGPGRVASL